MESEVSIPVHGAVLQATIAVPEKPRGFIIFAHGSGSGRHSPRNRLVAGVLNQSHFATVLADLLTASEEREDEITRQWRFDINLLAERLVGIGDWLASQEFAKNSPFGCFGASTGAAAALIAASVRPQLIKSVVSRGGRPDLAGDALPKVLSPTLLIVGGDDHEVLQLNRNAMRQMRCTVELEIVPGATHLFEEPGTLETVAEFAGRWFASWLK